MELLQRRPSFRDDMTDTARTHAQKKQKDVRIMGGCWLTLSPPTSDLSLGKRYLETFARELSLEICLLGTFAWSL